jgi:hypothetical protein
MLRTPPHPSNPADRTERLLAGGRVALVTDLTALHAAGLAGQVHWQRPGLSTHPAQARAAMP